MKVNKVDTISFNGIMLLCTENQIHAGRCVFGHFTISNEPFHKVQKYGILFLFFEMVRRKDAAL